MRTYVIAILALFVATLGASHAQAAASSATGVNYSYTAGKLNGVDWTPLVSSTTKAVKGITVLNLGAYTLELGIGLAGAASASDVRQIVIPTTTQMPAAVYIPMAIGQGYRISIRNLTSTGAVFTGSFMLNALYN